MKRLLVAAVVLVALVGGIYARLTPQGLWRGTSFVGTGWKSFASLWTIPHAAPGDPTGATTVWPPYSPVAATAWRLESAPFDPHTDLQSALSIIGPGPVSAVLHAANAILLLLLLWRMGIPLGAVVAACLWALHPMNAQAVVWPQQQSELWALLLGLLGATCWQRWIQRAGYGNALAATLLAIGAMLASPLLLPLPVGYWALSWSTQRTGKRDLWIVLPMIAGATFAGWLWHMQSAMGPVPSQTFSSLSAFRAAGFYIEKLFVPVRLSVIYSSSGAGWLAFFAVAILVILLILQRRIGRGPAAAGIFCLASLLPIVGLINRWELIWSPVADHLAYVASVGSCIVLGLAFEGLWRTREKRARAAGALHLAPDQIIALALAGVAILALGGVTFAHAAVFTSSESMYRDALSKYPDAGIAAENLADILRAPSSTPSAASLEEAQKLYRTAMAAMPWRTSAVCGLTQILEAQGDSKQAQDTLKVWADTHPNDAPTNALFADMVLRDLPSAILDSIRPTIYQRIEPYYVRALRADPTRGSAAKHLAQIYQSQAKIDQAATVLKLALPANARDPDIHIFLADMLALLNNYSEAARQYEIGVALDPTNAKAITRWGLMLLDDHRPEQAEKAFRRAMKVDGTRADLHVDLGRALRDQGNISGALSEFDTARNLDDRNVPALIEMARTYLQVGRESEADELLRGAISIDRDNLDAQLGLAQLMMTAKNSAYRNLDGATLLLRAAVLKHPQDINLLATYANALGLAGKYLEAADAFDSAATLADRMKLDPQIIAGLQAASAKMQFRAAPNTGRGINFSLVGTPFDVSPAAPWTDPPFGTIPKMMKTPIGTLWHESTEPMIGPILHFPSTSVAPPELLKGPPR